VPEKYKANLKLAGWVSRQQTPQKEISSVDRIAKLNKIGFIWEVHTNLPPRKDHATMILLSISKSLEIAVLVGPKIIHWPVGFQGSSLQMRISH
jgi:hypothetical protein